MSALSYETLRALALKMKRDSENVVASFQCGSAAYVSILLELPPKDGYCDGNGVVSLQGVKLYENHEMPLRLVRAYNASGKLLKEIQL